MNSKKLIPAILVVAILILSAANLGNCQSELGIKAGDTFVYAYSGTWRTNQTGVEAPSSIADSFNLEFIASYIMNVSGSVVTSNTSYCYGTGIYMEITDSDYGGGYLPFYIPPNLGTGDLIPNTKMDGSPLLPCYVNETVSREYGNDTRPANHLKIKMPFEGFQGVACDAYWDVATGVLVQITYGYSNSTGDTSTEWSVGMRLRETSLFQVYESLSPSPTPQPTVPELTPALAVLPMAAILVLAVVYRRKRKITRQC